MISIDIFVPEHGGDPLSAGKSRPGLGWSVLDVMKALEVERAAKMDGLWFTMVYPFSYHGLPLKIASNLWFSGCTTIFLKNILTDPSDAHRKKTRDVVECHAKLYPMPGHIWCAALSDFTPACPSMSMKIDGYRIMATYGHQIWGKQGVTVHMSIHI